jgi:hypothetical protein
MRKEKLKKYQYLFLKISFSEGMLFLIFPAPLATGILEHTIPDIT